MTAPVARFDNKVAVITGGTAGIGLAAARAFASEGAQVVIAGRDPSRLASALAVLGERASGTSCDSSDLGDLDRLFEFVARQHGRVDILFCNAGRGDIMAPVGSITDEAYGQIFDLNVRGTLFAVQKALPLIPDRGSIVLTGSMVGAKGFPQSSVYAASKAALRSFARTWTVDLKARGIRVNIVSPGSVETEAVAGLDERSRAFFNRMIPRGRFGTPEEVAAAVLFLASDDASFISGVELAVDGGVTQI